MTRIPRIAQHGSDNRPWLLSHLLRNNVQTLHAGTQWEAKATPLPEVLSQFSQELPAFVYKAKEALAVWRKPIKIMAKNQAQPCILKLRQEHFLDADRNCVSETNKHRLT